MISTRIYVEHPDIALSHAIRSLPDAEIGVVSDVGTDPERDVFFFWIRAPDFDAVEAALAEDPTVAEFSTVLETGDQRTYRIEYDERTKLVTPAVVESAGMTLASRSHADGWVLRLQLKDHDALLDLKAYADEEDIRLDVLELHQSDGIEDREAVGLTDPQREALVAAHLHGYFDEPRETSLEELAAVLELSTTALGGRIRRGSARLVEEFLVED